ncbi:zinc finger BED domain-containing protein 1-like [Rhizophagus clarus]|uniref:Zinc finger BED domain-containing protein 1-like n=1 Tax=Rhizophagus clarus TaxID=94130 RepID=A0A8H3M674_9GLOM|nr:zinc finger BED domain-containing protein 1-like [Rhizophagus clarus]
MELRDILLCIEPIKYPHIGSHICKTIRIKLKEFNLINKITTVITDNSSNMIKAIQEWESIERIPCSAHTLQLCVIKGLKKATAFIDRFKKLSIFFNSSKQNKKLEETQAELNAKLGEQHDLQNQLSNENQDNQNEIPKKYQPHILQTITEVSTRWGSALASWQKLRELKPAIRHVLVNLKWNLLNKLIELFKPIEDATEFLGDQKYCTLSLIYPTIQALKYSYATENDNNNDENSDNENNDNENNNEDSDEFDDFINSMDEQIDIITIINTIKEEIYNALYDYFDNPPNATILTFISRVFGFSRTQISIYEELSYYLDEIKTPQAFPKADPFEWWYDNQKRFPILYKIARKYLGIPAISVLSERLFSNADSYNQSINQSLKFKSIKFPNDDIDNTSIFSYIDFKEFEDSEEKVKEQEICNERDKIIKLLEQQKFTLCVIIDFIEKKFQWYKGTEKLKQLCNLIGI